MEKFNLEEINLICLYRDESNGRAELVANMIEALPYIDDADIKELAERTIDKIMALTDQEYSELSFYAADEI